MRKCVYGLLLLVSLSACKNDWRQWADDPAFYSRTVKQLNDIVLTNNFPPMIASRNYAYANIAAYECMAAGNPQYRSLAGQINGFPTMPASAIKDTQQISYHFAAVLAFCKVGEAVTFPAGSMQEFTDSLTDMMKDHGMPGAVFDNSKALADTVAAVVLQWSKKDKYAQLRSAPKFTVLDSPGRWIPTPPMYAQAVEPHWMEMRSLTCDSSNQFMPPLPPAYSEKPGSPFYAFANAVKKMGDSLTAEQKHIADFWDDNPFKMNVTGHVMYATKKFNPAGHWMNICGIAAQQTKTDVEENIAAHTLTSIALFDGFLICWDAKYRTNLLRPETYINKFVNTEWRPYIQTPPFPSYTSGHSTISAAAAEVLTHFYGEKLAYRDSSEREFGIKDRNFSSFRQAAQEASISRIYGGIHYSFDCDEGNKAGTKLGQYILRKVKLK
jgi:hypothetical protein